MAKPMKIGVCLKAEDNLFWSGEVRRGIDEAVLLNPAIVLRYQTPSNINQYKEQVQIIRSFIEDGTDAIVWAPSDPELAAALAKEISAAKIPLIILDTEINDFAPDVNKRILFVGFEDYAGGFETGCLLRKALGLGARVAVISGFKFGSYSKREKGFIDAISPQLKLSAVIPANFDEREAFEATRRLLKIEPNIQGIFATSDNMALGTITALQELGRTDVLVSGFDATYAGKHALESGRLLSTVDIDPQGLGRRAMRIAVDLLSGKPVATKSVEKVRLLTRENLTSLPKQAIQKRRYELCDAKPDLSEFPYDALDHFNICPIVVGGDHLKDLPPRLQRLKADAYKILTDSTVANLYGKDILKSLRQAGLECSLFSFPAGERNKTFTTLNHLAHQIFDQGVSKRNCVVVLGGGVPGNLAGFLAAIVMRGLRFVHIPTTVMSQIDSTTGAKQAVNMPHGKNLLGTFYEPEFIYINPHFIRTLPPREFRSGIAEAIKHGLCHSPQLLTLIAAGDYLSLLKETIRLKTELIERDPREKHEGLILVYGHTIGHALEIAGDHTLTHGEAISIGMVAAAMISVELGLAKSDLVSLHEEILIAQGLPIRIPHSIKPARVLQTLYYDKKDRNNLVPFVLLKGVNDVAKADHAGFLFEVEESIVSRVLSLLHSGLGSQQNSAA